MVLWSKLQGLNYGAIVCFFFSTKKAKKKKKKKFFKKKKKKKRLELVSLFVIYWLQS